MTVSAAVSGLRSVCQAATRLCGVDGASVSLFSADGARARVTASSLWVAHVDELQFELGEGPCFEAYRTGGPVEAADLGAGADAFPAFAQAVSDIGVGWMRAMPVHHGDVVVGVFDLVARDPHGPVDRARPVGELFAPMVGLGLAQMGSELDVDEFDDELSAYRWGVHQAIGVLRARYGLETGAALARLRARAFASGLGLDQTALSVVRSTEVDPHPDGAAKGGL